jgi:NAD(P)-dependent dehydrogenase (short-subunit alcohol dehydrogenase family)
LGGLYVHCDVGSQTQVNSTVAQVVAAHGRIDVLVNNAGIFKAADFLDVTEEDFDAVLRVNLKGAFLMGQAVAREMARQASGAIVNMSSVNGVMAIPNIASYNVSKGGINQLTRVMALALADHGIRVNAVAPGTIATELAAQAVLTSEAARTKISEPHAHEAAGPARRNCRRGGLAGQRRGQLRHGRNRHGGGGRMALNYTVPV